jgi:hypothetical protein
MAQERLPRLQNGAPPGLDKHLLAQLKCKKNSLKFVSPASFAKCHKGDREDKFINSGQEVRRPGLHFGSQCFQFSRAKK